MFVLLYFLLLSFSSLEAAIVFGVRSFPLLASLPDRKQELHLSKPCSDCIDGIMDALFNNNRLLERGRNIKF